MDRGSGRLQSTGSQRVGHSWVTEHAYMGLGKHEQQTHGKSYPGHKRIFRMTECLLYWYLCFTLNSSLTLCLGVCI